MSDWRKNLENPYYKERWYKLTSAQRLWLILRGLDQNLITDDEVGDLLLKQRIYMASAILFPVGLFFVSKFASRALMPLKFTRQYNHGKRNFFPALVAAIGGVDWAVYGPTRKSFEDERENVLHILEDRIRGGILMLNEMVPYGTTEYDVARRIRVLRNERTSVFTNVLYPVPEKERPSGDKELMPNYKIERKVF